jgi:FkbM family methyltransferase
MHTFIAQTMAYIRVWKDYRTIKSSGLFDTEWYMQTYPEAQSSRLSPLWHYVLIGACNGYKPNADFDSKWYLANYSDVSALGVNPLVHYIVAGKSESRLPAPPLAQPMPEITKNTSVMVTPTSWSVRERIAHIGASAVYNDYPAYKSQDTFNPPTWDLPEIAPKRRPEAQYQKALYDAMSRFDAQYDAKKLDETYQLLSDLYSREILIYVLAGRILGTTKYRLPIHFSHIWRLYPLVTQCGDGRDVVIRGGLTLHKYDLKSIGHDLRMFSAPMGIFINFILEQYKYANKVYAKDSNVVIDGGTFLGETALYFAERVGQQGKVYAFEFMPSNIEILHQNLEMNPIYQSVIELVERPLWSDSKTQLTADDRGPGSSLRAVDNHTEHTFTTISLDDFARAKSLTQVDFIKLDIEGAELATIEGARMVITTFKPQLAICIYHKNSDFWQIPQLLHEMVPEYEFYVDHFVPFPNWETVLFARVRS